jgi:hypothetical protein
VSCLLASVDSARNGRRSPSRGTLASDSRNADVYLSDHDFRNCEIKCLRAMWK